MAAFSAMRVSQLTERVAAEAVDVAVAAEESFLDRVGGRVAVVDDADDEREEVVLVERDELVERVEIAGDGTLDERAIAHVVRVIGDGPPRLTGSFGSGVWSAPSESVATDVRTISSTKYRAPHSAA